MPPQQRTADQREKGCKIFMDNDSTKRGEWIRDRVDELTQSADWQGWTPEKGEELKRLSAEGRHYGYASPREQAEHEYGSTHDEDGRPICGGTHIGFAGLPSDARGRGIAVQSVKDDAEHMRIAAKKIRKHHEVLRHSEGLQDIGMNHAVKTPRTAGRASHRVGSKPDASGGGSDDSGDSDCSDDPDLPRPEKRAHVLSLTPKTPKLRKPKYHNKRVSRCCPSESWRKDGAKREGRRAA
jgi:hypothetical protein